MSSRSQSALFETTHSALMLPCPSGGGMLAPDASSDSRKSNLDKNFWILRELGRHLALVDHGVELLDLRRCPEGIPT